MIVNAGLLIDFGNSETRVKVINSSRVFSFKLSNRFADLPAGYTIPNKYGNEKSTVFGVNGSYFANGALADREFSGSLMRPSALQAKTDQLVTDLTLNLVFIKALILLSKVHNVAISQLEVTFNVSALLPPLDHEVNERQLVEKIQNMNRVISLVPVQMDATFNIGNIMVNSEAVAAFFGAFYKEVGVSEGVNMGDITVVESGNNVQLLEEEKNTQFSTGYSLVLDIGAGTTDVALFKDMELVERSKDTFNLGGNTVQSIVGQEIRKIYGYAPESIEEVVKTGLLPEGTEYHDVSEIVTKAKAHYASSMMENIRQYLERMSVPMPLVKGLLAAGGGALPSIRDGQVVSPAMSELLVKYLQQLAPRIQAFHTEGKNLRELNIEGLMYIHKYA